jgi:hypothetical protein
VPWRISQFNLVLEQLMQRLVNLRGLTCVFVLLIFHYVFFDPSSSVRS